MPLRKLELNGGVVTGSGSDWALTLPPTSSGYADAQIDDYGLVDNGRSQYPWSPGTHLQLHARFSHPVGVLQGTAGFGFWNAPFGDPTVRWPALPQAVWFLYASAPSDLPLAPVGQAGRGWFAATLDATAPRARALIPLAPLVVVANQSRRVRQRLWPWVQERLGISFAPLTVALDAWHRYELAWQPEGCTFRVDGDVVLATSHSPAGPLGFVCWVDNQYMVAAANGRFRWGTLSTDVVQRLEVADLRLATAPAA